MSPLRPGPRQRRTFLRWRTVGWVIVGLMMLLLTYAAIDFLGRLGEN